MANYKTKVNRIGNESLNTLGQRIVDTVNSSAIAEAKASKYFLQLLDVNNRFRQSLIPPEYNKLTKDINTKLLQCEEAFLDSYDYLNGLQKSPDADMQAAATILFRIASQFGRKFRNIKAAECISRYGRILEELKKPENAAAVTTTLLTEKLAAFASFYEEHETLFRKRGNIRSVNITGTTMRKEMLEAVKLCLEDLQWQTRVVDTEEWRVLCRNVEHRFDEMNISRSQTVSEVEDTVTMPSNVNSGETLPA